MKEIKLNFEYIGLLILAFIPIYPYFLISLSLVLFCVFKLISCARAGCFFDKSELRSKGVFILIYVGFFLFFVLSFLFRDNVTLNFKEIQASIPLLLFPFAFLLKSEKISSPQIRNVYKCFVLSCTILIGVILFYTILEILKNGGGLDTVGHILSKISFLDLHTVYVSMMLLIGLCMIYELFIDYKIGIIRLSLFITGVLFVFVIIFLASRIAIITLSFLLIRTIFKYLNISFIKKIFVLVLSVASIGFVMLLSKKVDYQFSQLKFEELQLPNKKWPTSPQIRLGIYKCSIEIISTSGILGIGPYDFKEGLNNCYLSYNNHREIRYNSHNYYLYLLGAGGVISLLLFLLPFIVTFIYNRIGFLGTNFFIILFLFSLTENILSRSYGASIYFFMIMLFALTDCRRLRGAN